VFFQVFYRDTVLSLTRIANVINWTGGPTHTGTNWSVPANWEGNVLPGPNDHAVISRDFQGITITLPSQTTTIQSVTSAANLVLSGGTFSIAATSEISGAFTLSGGILTGAGTLNVGGLLTWAGGFMTGSGTTNAQGGLQLAGGSPKELDRTLNNAALATWTDSGPINMGSGGVFNNLATATFEAQNDQAFTTIGGGAMPVFNNAGTFRKVQSGGTTIISGSASPLAFNNTGTVDVQTGTLRLGGGGTASGIFTVAANAILDFSGGAFIYNLNSGSVVSGSTVSFSSGTTNVNGSYTGIAATLISGGTANFVVDASTGTLTLSGTLTGTGAFTVTGLLTWAGGAMTGSSTTNAQGGLQLSGGSSKSLIGRTLNNAVLATWTGGTVFMDDGAVFNNLATATFDAQNDQVFARNSGGGATPAFNNVGTFRKSASTGTTTISGSASPLAFNNTGTVDVQTGTLRLGGGGTTGGNFMVAAAAVLDFGGGTLTLTGTLSGSGMVQGNVINSGVIQPGQPGVPGILTINGNYTQTASGTLNIEIGGPNPGTGYDQLVVTGTATLDGTLNVSLLNGFVPNVGDRFQILTFGSRSGDFMTENGLDLGGGLRFDPQYDASSLTLVTTTAPAPAPRPAGPNAGRHPFEAGWEQGNSSTLAEIPGDEALWQALAVASQEKNPLNRLDAFSLRFSEGTANGNAW
jgi:hypothetical protein